MKTTITGFRKTDIWPLGPDVFTDDDFLHAETDIAADSRNMTETASGSSCDQTSQITPEEIRSENSDMLNTS
jgi:hypothetical protein